MSRTLFSLAGFRVITTGWFWVVAEEQGKPDELNLPATIETFVTHCLNSTACSEFPDKIWKDSYDPCGPVDTSSESNRRV